MGSGLDDLASRGCILVDKALILIAVQDISAQHGEGEEEEKGLTKPPQSKAIVLVMFGYVCKHFSPQQLILYTRSGLQVRM